MAWAELLKHNLNHSPMPMPQVSFSINLGYEDRAGNIQLFRANNSPTVYALRSLLSILAGYGPVSRRIGAISTANNAVFYQSLETRRNTLTSGAAQLTSYTALTSGITGIVGFEARFIAQRSGTVNRVILGDWQIDVNNQAAHIIPFFVASANLTALAGQTLYLQVTAWVWVSTVAGYGVTLGSWYYTAPMLRDLALLAFLPLRSLNPVPTYSRTYALQHLAGITLLASPAIYTYAPAFTLISYNYMSGEPLTVTWSALSRVSLLHTIRPNVALTVVGIQHILAPATVSLIWHDATLIYTRQSGTVASIQVNPALALPARVTHRYTAIWSFTASALASPVGLWEPYSAW